MIFWKMLTFSFGMLFPIQRTGVGCEGVRPFERVLNKQAAALHTFIHYDFETIFDLRHS